MEETQNNTVSVNLDNKDRAYATGKRKNSIARIWLKKGEGGISINGKSIDKYFSIDFPFIEIPPSPFLSQILAIEFFLLPVA